MSVFSSYSTVHGNVKDWTGIILSAEDAQLLARHGFVVHSPIGVAGFVGENGTKLVLSSQNVGDRLRIYDANTGKLIFAVALPAVRRRTASGERPLNRNDDISVNHLQAIERDGRLLLVSTARSVLRASKKRNTGFGRPQTRFHPAIPAMTDQRRGGPFGNAAEQASHDARRPGLIAQWGDDLGLRVPHDLAARLGLAVGTRVDIAASEDGQLIITPSRRHFTLEELLAGMTPEREHVLEDDGPMGEELI